MTRVIYYPHPGAVNPYHISARLAAGHRRQAAAVIIPYGHQRILK